MEISVQTIEDLLQESLGFIRLELQEIGIDIGNLKIEYVDRYYPFAKTMIAQANIGKTARKQVKDRYIRKVAMPTKRLSFLHFGLFFSYDALMPYEERLTSVLEDKGINKLFGKPDAPDIIIYKGMQDFLDGSDKELWLRGFSGWLAHEIWHIVEAKLGIINYSMEGTAEVFRNYFRESLAVRLNDDIVSSYVTMGNIDQADLEYAKVYSLQREIAQKHASIPQDLLDINIRQEIENEIIDETKRIILEDIEPKDRRFAVQITQIQFPQFIRAFRTGYTTANYVRFLRRFGADRMAYEASWQDCSRYLAFLEGLFEEHKDLLVQR